MTARHHTITFSDDSRLAALRHRAGGDGREASYVLRCYGPGHWIEGTGVPIRFFTEEQASLHGRHWDETGRDVASNEGKRLFGEWLAALKSELMEIAA